MRCFVPRGRQVLVMWAVSAGVVVCYLAAVVGAQTVVRIANANAPAQGAAAPSRPARPATTRRVQANLLQLMRGILYPSSNVIFAAQADLSKLPPAADPSVSPNPLTSTYGGWQAVENAALAIAESANLVL